MSSHDFWHEDAELFWIYRKAYIAKEQERVRETDLNAWLIGNYVHVGVEVALAQAFAKKDAINLPEYPSAPKMSEAEPEELSEEESLLRAQQEQIARIKQAYSKLASVPKIV